MNKKTVLFLSLFSLLFSACCSTKTKEVTSTLGKSDFYDYAWELEYLSGARIAFEGLYPENKPYIIFKEAGSQFSGNTSCNVYSGKYTKKENSIQFGDAIKTMIFCEGGGNLAAAAARNGCTEGAAKVSVHRSMKALSTSVISHED